MATDEQVKQARREASRRFTERKARNVERAKKAAEELITFFTETGRYETLSANARDFLSAAANPGKRRVFSVSSIFSQIFGEMPELGTSLTLKEIFDKTLKGKATIDMQLKKWAAKGIIVECEECPNSPLNTTYTLVAMP